MKIILINFGILVIFAILLDEVNCVNPVQNDHHDTMESDLLKFNTTSDKAALFHYRYYRGQISDARCIARCNDLLKDNVTKSKKHMVYKISCDSLDCHTCYLGCKFGSQINQTCENSCLKVTSTHRNLFNVCSESCSFRTKIEKEGNVIKSNMVQNEELDFKPEVICQRMDVHVVIVELFWPIKLESNNSLGFVVQVQTRDLEETNRFMDAGNTERNTVSLELKPDEEYRVIVTVVTLDGTIGKVSSEWFKTMPKELNLVPPENFTIHNQVALTKRLAEVEISWIPPKHKPCFYNIYGLPLNATSSSYLEQSVTRPEELLTPIKLSGLSYSTWYEIRVSTTIHGENVESEYSTFDLLTKSCLELNNFNFTICGPNAPENIRIENFSNVTTCKISWNCPKNTTSNNQVSEYKIKISEEYYEGATNLVPEEIYVDGNVTSVELTLPKLQYTSYQVSVFAVSPGGLSDPVSTIVTLKKAEPADTKLNWVTWVLTVIGGILSLFCVVLIVNHIRNVNSDINSCLLSSKKPQIKNSWVSPLKRKLLNKCPYHIDINMICLKEVLGSGAFGVVHKGTAMIRGVEEIVAIKMLKESASNEAESSLLEEIEMLKFLGHHPHIVTLRGYVISLPKIALLVEYCELGDLKKYLDNLREESVKLLLSDESGFGSKSGCNTSLNDSGSLGCDRSYNSSLNELEGITTELLDDQMKDIPVITERTNDSGLCSSSKSNSLQRASSNVSGNSNVSTDSDNGSDLQSSAKWEQYAKKFVSYARQIAIGMDFLASNKVIHRDLAARNILLFSQDQVKITDFGLSRDIYECGVYSKSSSGMLPIKWMALESIISQTYTTKSDVWSFGILLWEIISLGGTPYPGYSNREVLPLLQSGYRMAKPCYLSDEIYEIMENCWRSDPGSRPSFKKLQLSLEKVLEGFETYISM